MSEVDNKSEGLQSCRTSDEHRGWFQGWESAFYVSFVTHTHFEKVLFVFAQRPSP